MEVKRTERGWGGHYCCCNQCRFRRNTLLEYGDEKIVVSTVGLRMNDYTHKFEPVGLSRYFETMAFFANLDDTRYYDIDVSQEINFDSKWAIYEIDADDEANDMHEKVVEELSEKLKNGLVREERHDEFLL